MQALSKAHSELIKHSGLQDGGVPIKSVLHEHTACLFISRHILFGPHGDGLQGSVGVGVAIKVLCTEKRVSRQLGRRRV